MTVRTRFAPSPTGYLHIGGARTALYCWLEARHRGGEFVLRIEDTDRERSTQAAIDAILEAMDWLGLNYDEGPIYQTHRVARYKEVAEQLLAAGKAYYAYETREELEAMREAAMAKQEKPRYNGAARELNLPYRDDPNRVIRFKNPQGGSVVFDDLIKGRIEIANSELDDMVIFRPDGYPTYNFAVVVDDWDMGITEVIRGDDHINNTPRQINIYEALGAAVPKFGHMPMILDEAGAKLSKRTGAAERDAVQGRRLPARGAAELPGAAGLVAWRSGNFQPAGIDRPVRREQLQFQGLASGHGQARLGQPALPEERRPGGHRAASALPVGKAGFGYRQWPGPGRCRHRPARARADLEGNGRKSRGLVHAAGRIRRSRRCQALQARRGRGAGQARELLAALPQWSAEAVGVALHDTAAALEIGMGKIAQPLRVAITGTQVSPDISHTVYLAGRDEALKRIDAALAF